MCQSLIVCGESTSGCVRASVVDAYSSGFHVSIVEECTYDRAELTHKVNLFDLHHKYADVMHLDEVVAHSMAWDWRAPPSEARNRCHGSSMRTDIAATHAQPSS